MQWRGVHLVGECYSGWIHKAHIEALVHECMNDRKILTSDVLAMDPFGFSRTSFFSQTVDSCCLTGPCKRTESRELVLQAVSG